MPLDFLGDFLGKPSRHNRHGTFPLNLDELASSPPTFTSTATSGNNKYQRDYCHLDESTVNRVEDWRQETARLGPGRSQRPREHAGRSPRNPDPPSQVAYAQRPAAPSTRPSKPQTTPKSGVIDRRQFQQGHVTKDNAHPKSASNSYPKFIPQLHREPPTLHRGHQFKPAQIQSMWCINCQMIPPDGTVCRHGVFGPPQAAKRA